MDGWMDGWMDEWIKKGMTKQEKAPITEKIKENCLSWYGHQKRREEKHVTSVMNMNVEGRRGRGRPKKR
jgi:hypothetical protein